MSDNSRTKPGHHYDTVRYVEDSGTIKGCELVLFGYGPQIFALTCRHQNRPMLLPLLKPGTLPSGDKVRGPTLTTPDACVSFGGGFTVMIDPHSIEFAGTSSVGCLVIGSDGLCVVAESPAGHHCVNLRSGDVVPRPQASAPTVRAWSISVDRGGGSSRKSLFGNPSSSRDRRHARPPSARTGRHARRRSHERHLSCGRIAGTG